MKAGKTTSIQVDKIIYESDKQILVEWKGESYWLRKSEIDIRYQSDGIEISMPTKYYKKKIGKE